MVAHHSNGAEPTASGGTYNAAGAAPGLPLLPKSPAKNCCTILERVRSREKKGRLRTNRSLFVLGDKSAAPAAVDAEHKERNREEGVNPSMERSGAQPLFRLNHKCI